MSQEYYDYKCLLEEVKNKTLKNRIDLSLKYYIDKAILYKRLWNYLSILSIILPATATFIACFNEWDLLQWLLPLITSFTTIIAGLLTLFKCADKKTSYRESAEKLKSEVIAYVNNCNDYANGSKNKDSILCNRVENIITDGYAKIFALEDMNESSNNHNQDNN